MSAVMQLGLPGSVPVPTDDDKSPKRKSESGGRSGANKAGRATETRRGLEPPGLGRELGAEGAENRQLTISMVDFERLLDRQSATILQANREHAQGLLDALEARHGSRLDALEGGATKVQTGIAQMEERLAALERTVQNQLGHPGGAEAKRRHTLVFGGWDRDTRREKVLRELQEAVTGLGLDKLVSEKAFTTGPRRSVAMMNFPLQASETDDDRRSRMHQMVLALSQAQVVTSAGKRLWCSYSRTKQQRDVSSHCGWIKRALGNLDAEWAREVDLEYSTGSAWLGNSLVGSATRDPDADMPSEKLLWHMKGSSKAWVAVGKLAKETKLAEDDIRMALEDTKR
eukprot:s1323_g2.t1